MDIIKVRLKNNKWKGGLNSFITKEAFWTLQYMTGGHARMALSAIRAAMEYIEFNELKRQITAESLLSGFELFRDKVVETKHMPIIQYLLHNGSSSTSDNKFQKAIELSRSGLHKYMQELVQRNCVQTTKTDGITQKQEYFINKLDNW